MQCNCDQRLIRERYLHRWASQFHYQEVTLSRYVGITALHVAAYFGNELVLQFLLGGPGSDACDAMRLYCTTWNGACGAGTEPTPAELPWLACRLLFGIERTDPSVQVAQAHLSLVGRFLTRSTLRPYGRTVTRSTLQLQTTKLGRCKFCSPWALASVGNTWLP